jgi:hypothetical protein
MALSRLSRQVIKEGRVPRFGTPPIIDDIVEVVTIAVVFPLSVVLSYSPTRIIIGQTPIVVGRGCCFTLSLFCPIVRSVTTRGLTLMVFGRWCCCDDIARCLNPMLGQGDEWRVMWDHPMN